MTALLPRAARTPTRLVHLSDLHFGATDPAVVAALAHDLQRTPADLVIVSGDLTMGARRREFAAARAFLKGLGSPVLAVPGNHDVSPYRLIERFFDPWRPWREYVDRDVEPFWSNGRVAVAGLNSARAWGRTLDWSEGRIHQSQLRRLATLFEPLPDACLRVVTIHHPLALPSHLADHDRVHRAEQVLACLALLQVDLVLTGHLHVQAVHALAAAPAAAAAEPSRSGRPPLFVQGASATSRRLRGEPNSYFRITVMGRDFALDHRVWTGEGFASADAPGTDAAEPQPPTAAPPLGCSTWPVI